MLRWLSEKPTASHRSVRKPNMPTAPTDPAASPGHAELADAILRALAEVQARPVAELEAEAAANGGDIEIASPEAVAVIAVLEDLYGHPLAHVEDLEPEQLTSLASLSDLMTRRWPQPAGADHDNA
jgi:hypothetical protein